MYYRMLWKIVLKNKWICYSLFVCFCVMFYKPVITTYNAVSRFSNVALNEINLSFLSNCLIWYSIMFFVVYELMIQIKDTISQVLWISSKVDTYKKVFLFSITNNIIVSAFVLAVQTILFICFGQGYMSYLLKVIIDVFFYYFVVGVIATLIAMVVSVITKQLAGVVLGIISIIAISPVLDLLYSPQIEKIQKYFEILPQATNSTYDFDSGHHISAFSIGLIIVWVSFASLLLLGLLRHFSKKCLVFSAIGILLGLYIVNMPYIERFDSGGYSNPDTNIYYAFNNYNDIDVIRMTNDEALENAGFAVLKYEMEIEVRWKLRNKVKIWVDNTTLDSYVFTLYNRYEVSSIKDQNNNPLEYKRSEDTLQVSGTGDIEYVVVEYEGSAAPCQADFESIRLYAGFPWYPYPGEQQVVSAIKNDEYDIETIGYTDCKNNVTEYSVSVSSVFDVYSNLEKENDVYVGETDILMLSGGMMVEEIEGNIHYVYPVELSYYYKYNNGIEDWKEEVYSILIDAKKDFDPDEEVYCFYGNKYVFASSLDTKGFVLGENMIMYNWN